jgi:mRNA interferase MazF
LPHSPGPAEGWCRSLELTQADGVPTSSVVNFDNIHTIPREVFRRRVTALSPGRVAEGCRTLQAATGC